MYTSIYQIKKDKYNSENGNSLSNNYDFLDNFYKERQLENKKKNISL